MKKISLCVFLFGLIVPLLAQQIDRLCIFNSERINQLKINPAKNDVLLLVKLMKDADKALDDSLYSVTFKKQSPPSGNKHDYMSLAPYWWPDTTKADGLPYIRKDGLRNPEAKEYSDNTMLNKMSKDVIKLSVAYAISQEKKYVDKANQFLCAWFLDSLTCMNPNLNYAQAVKGKNYGKGSGIIETRSFVYLLDAIELLRKDSLFDKHTYPSLKRWFEDYLFWLDNSKVAYDERLSLNNHVTWFSAQYTRIAYFVGKDSMAYKELGVLKTRIAWQIEPDGKQPLELDRTKSLYYSLFNIQAYFIAFSIADKYDLNFWSFETTDGRSVKKALDYVLPFIHEKNKWPGKQITEVSLVDYYGLLKMATMHYTDSSYKNYLELDLFKGLHNNLLNIIY